MLQQGVASKNSVKQNIFEKQSVCLQFMCRFCYPAVENRQDTLSISLSSFPSLFVNDLDAGQCFPLQQRKGHTFLLSTSQFHLLLHLMRLLLCWSQVQPEWVLCMVLES